jgi:preprotein translocase subunit SecA
VVNEQRRIIYEERNKILEGADLRANILSMVREELQGIVAYHTAGEHGDGWDLEGLTREVLTILPLPPEINASVLPQMKPGQIEERLIELAEALYGEKEKEIGPEGMRVVERLVMLRTIDSLWVEHLTAMENMREGIGLQALAQRDPLVAYKTQGHQQFQNLLEAIQHDVVHTIYHVGLVKKEAPAPSPMAKAAGNRGGTSKPQPKVAGKKVGRNDPCPCGSGKKYKHCCGR